MAKGRHREGDVRALLENAHARFPGDEAAAFLRESWGRAASRGKTGAVSRQARHARFVRARNAAVCASYAQAVHDPDYARLAVSPAFGALRPFCAESQSRFIHMADTLGAFTLKDCEVLWERGVTTVLEVARRAQGLGTEDLLMLVFTEELGARLLKFHQQNTFDDDLRGLMRSFAKIEKVQIIERNRLFRIWERPLPGPVRQHMKALWDSSFQTEEKPAGS